MKRVVVALAAIAFVATACGDNKGDDNSLSGAAVATTTTAKAPATVAAPTTTTTAANTFDTGDLSTARDPAARGGDVSYLNIGYKAMSRNAVNYHLTTPYDDDKAFAQLKRVTWVSPPTGNLTLVMFFPPDQEAAYNELNAAFDLTPYALFGTVAFQAGDAVGTTSPGRPISGAIRSHTVGTTTGGKTITMTIQPVHQQLYTNGTTKTWGY